MERPWLLLLGSLIETPCWPKSEMCKNKETKICKIYKIWKYHRGDLLAKVRVDRQVGDLLVSCLPPGAHPWERWSAWPLLHYRASNTSLFRQELLKILVTPGFQNLMLELKQCMKGALCLINHSINPELLPVDHHYWRQQRHDMRPTLGTWDWKYFERPLKTFTTPAAVHCHGIDRKEKGKEEKLNRGEPLFASFNSPPSFAEKEHCCEVRLSELCFLYPMSLTEL